MFAALAVLGSAARADASQPRVTSARADDLPEVARSVPPGASLRIEAADLEGLAQTGLDLVRFEPIAAGARMVLQTESGPRTTKPEIPVYLRGNVDGLRGSIVVVSVRGSGEMRGVVSAEDGTWMLSRRPGRGAMLLSRRVENLATSRPKNFSCEVLDNPTPPRVAASSTLRAQRLPITHTAQIAVELDYDYFLNFGGDSDAAIVYALDLMAFTGALGESELGMNVQVPFLQLWTTSADPYSSGTARLDQLRSRWNTAGQPYCGGSACTGIARSTVLLLSSANTGGVAYVPGLCDSWHSATGGFAYAYAGSISGDFDIDNPAAVWDIFVTTHELGHNFGSTHTHCFNPPVDGCFNQDAGCFAGAESLPSGCPGAGQGCGTIMSYCHLQAGGGSNIALTYGAGHPYGDTPDRVPAAMMSRIAIEAADAPGCLAATGGMRELLVEKAGAGSGVVTSSPAGINCGNGCRSYFDADTVVTLTPTPSAFSGFVGWSGDPDCSDGVVTLSSAASCTATFDGNCGVGGDDCDDGDPCTQDSCPAGDHCESSGAPRDPGSCRAASKTRLKISDSADPQQDRFQWQWKGGDAFDQVDLGAPSLTTTYTLCVYDASGGVTQLATSLSIPAGDAHWRDLSPLGWKFTDGDAMVDGVKQVQIKPGVVGQSKVKLSGAGGFLPLPLAFSATKFFDQDPSVVVQLLTSDNQCWTSTFVASGTLSNRISAFKASGN